MYSLSKYVIVSQAGITGLNLVASLADQPPSVEPVMTAPACCLLLFKAGVALPVRVLVVMIVRTASCVV